MVKEIDALNQRQRDEIYGHLEALLEGAMEDQMWRRSVALAESQRTADDRFNRVWKFFHPTPCPPRTLRSSLPLSRCATGCAPASAPLCSSSLWCSWSCWWRHAARSTPFLGLLAGLVGLAAFVIGGADRHYRRNTAAGEGSTDSSTAAAATRSATGGLRPQRGPALRPLLRPYVPEAPTGPTGAPRPPDPSGICATRSSSSTGSSASRPTGSPGWSDTLWAMSGEAWERDTLTAYRLRCASPPGRRRLHVGGLALLAAGSLWVDALPSWPAPPCPAQAGSCSRRPSRGASRALSFRIIAERRRVADDQAERSRQGNARWEAYHRWCHKLSDKPSDTEMAAWLECDRKILVDEAMQHYRLKPSHVIAHAFIEAPAPSYKRARYPQGPWRYSRYRLLLFLLTDDGVRQVNIDLDFKAGSAALTQRLNYRFDAVAAVRIDGSRHPTADLRADPVQRRTDLHPSERT